jgi:hypothetical protein
VPTPAAGQALKPQMGEWSAYSDERLKKDVIDFRHGLADLTRVRPVTFKYNGLGVTQDDGVEYVGVIAQELEKVMPSMISSIKEKLHEGDAADTDVKVVDPSAFTFMLINAVKEQQKAIDEQEARIASLEAGRRPLISGIGEGGIGLGMLAFAGAVVATRRKRSDARS